MKKRTSYGVIAITIATAILFTYYNKGETIINDELIPLSSIAVNISDLGAHSIEEEGFENYDSTEAIQKALDIGGTVDLGSGTYNVSKQLVIKSDTIIISKGATINKMFNIDGTKHLFTSKDENPNNITISNLTLNLKPNSSILNQNAAAIIFANKVENLLIENIVFLNTGNECLRLVELDKGQNHRNISIKNNTVNTVERPTGPMFWFQQVDGFNISSNSISKGKGQVWLRLCKNGEITGNQFLGIDNFWQKDAHLGGVELYYGCDNIKIDSNVIESNGRINDPNIVGIRSKNSSNISITNNNINWSNLSSEAINVRKDSTYDINPYNHYITGNTVTGDSEVAIKIISITDHSSINDVLIEKNICLNSSIVLHGTQNVEGISYNNIKIIENTVSGISSFGLPNTNCEISNNIIVSNDSGAAIYARNMVDSNIIGNKIVGNENTNTGIDYSYSNNLTIDDNSFTDIGIRFKSFNSINTNLNE